MCGITACISRQESASIYCLDGLKQLQNRGYDSAGICNINNNRFITIKKASTHTSSALDYIENAADFTTPTSISIGHTRWATHGSKNDVNSHPHISSDGKIAVVHNGIIDNYATLKQMLIENNYTFQSETDTEVIANLIAFNYAAINHDHNRVSDALRCSLEMLEGTYALAILCIDTPSKMYVTRCGSPILVGHTDNLAIITSEQAGFCNKITNYIILKKNDICTIENGTEITVATTQTYTSKPVNKNNFTLSPAPFPHWTIKEIYEQPESSLRAISLGGRLIDNNKIQLGGLNSNKDQLSQIDNIILLGCGTSYNAGMIGMNYFKELCNFNTVQLFDGADFYSKDIPKYGKTALILLSQSGETCDLQRCIKIGKDHDLFLMGVVNVVDSLIAREVDCGCYLNAGREVGVASTKSYLSQVIILNMMALWFSETQNINVAKRTRYIKDLRNLSNDIKNTILACDKRLDEFVPLFSAPNCFILGKGNGESIAREGALKIKEISYIHAEGYSTSSLKHGPFALLTENLPVILLAPDDNDYHKNESAYEEIKSRLATIIYVTNKSLDDECLKDKDIVINVADNDSFRDLLCVIPLQLLAYKLAVSRGLNPDMPRNLAKVVTVH